MRNEIWLPQLSNALPHRVLRFRHANQRNVENRLRNLSWYLQLLCDSELFVFFFESVKGNGSTELIKLMYIEDKIF